MQRGNHGRADGGWCGAAQGLLLQATPVSAGARRLATPGPQWFGVATEECSLCSLFLVIQKHYSRKSERELEMRTPKKKEEVYIGQSPLLLVETPGPVGSGRPVTPPGMARPA